MFFVVVVVVANIRWQFNQYASLLQSYENCHYFFIVILEFSSATVADSDLEHEFVIRILTYSTPTSFRVLLAPLALLDLLVLSVTQARGLVIHMGFWRHFCVDRQCMDSFEILLVIANALCKSVCHFHSDHEPASRVSPPSLLSAGPSW